MDCIVLHCGQRCAACQISNMAPTQTGQRKLRLCTFYVKGTSYGIVIFRHCSQNAIIAFTTESVQHFSQSVIQHCLLYPVQRCLENAVEHCSEYNTIFKQNVIARRILWNVDRKMHYKYNTIYRLSVFGRTLQFYLRALTIEQRMMIRWYMEHDIYSMRYNCLRGANVS